MRSLDRLTSCSSVLLTFPAGKSDLAAVTPVFWKKLALPTAA